MSENHTRRRARRVDTQETSAETDSSSKADVATEARRDHSERQRNSLSRDTPSPVFDNPQENKETEYAGEGPLRRQLTDIEVVLHDKRLINGDFSAPHYIDHDHPHIVLRAMINSTRQLKAGQSLLVDTGVEVKVPSDQFVGFVYPIQNRAHEEGLTLLEGVSVVEHHRNETLKVRLFNSNPSTIARNYYMDRSRSINRRVSLPNDDAYVEIRPGQRIARLLFQPVERPMINVRSRT